MKVLRLKLSPGSRLSDRHQSHSHGKRMRRVHALTAGVSIAAAAIILSGCNAPGHPKPGPEVPRPDQIVSFDALYSQNCSACHGAHGDDGPAYPIANPVFQALITPAILHRIIAQGDPGTSMPPFSQKYGGMLTEQQVDVLVSGIRQKWYKPAVLSGQVPPPYDPTQPGDPVRGKTVFQQNCATCHGMPPKGVSAQMNIFDPDFLSLVSNEVLRTIVIAGRPELGMPNWLGDIPGGQGLHAKLTNQDVTDIVAYLSTLRPVAPVSQAGTPPPPPPSYTTAKVPAQKAGKRAGGNK